MKTKYSALTSIFIVLLFALFLNGCGDKDSSEGKGSSESTEENTEETKKQSTNDESNNAGEVTRESTSSGSAGTDQMIDEYQEIIDEYVKIVKEMQSGDMSNVKNMQELATKTQEWSMKLTAIAPTLTPAQQERLKKISKEAEMYLKK